VTTAFDLLHPKLRNVLPKFGYERPTPVQERAIPTILAGHHTLIVAPTGTGKTEAAMFPVISRLLELRDRGELGRGTYVLYITPLRALNRDILRRMKDLAEVLGLKVAIRHGDTPEVERRRQVKEPPTILITTPETLQFIIVGKKLRETLRSLRWVIVDEVHEIMYDKRGTQLSLALERLVDVVEREFQRIGLSATIGDVELARRFLGGTSRRVEVINVGAERKLDVRVEWVYSREDPSDERKNLEARLDRIREIIAESTSVLLFTNTRDTAESLAVKLRNLEVDARVHHGSLSREYRERVEYEFKVGDVRTVVCTSSLELGIDIGHVDLVIQYMSPRQVTRLIQRVGRSKHRLGEAAKGIVMTADLDDTLEAMVIARRAVQGKLEKFRPHFNALDVLAHQVIGYLLVKRVATIDELYELARRSYLYSRLRLEDLVKVLRFLEEIRYIKFIDEKTVRLRRGTYRYYFESASMIPDVRHYRVIDIASGSTVGELDEDFVAVYCEPGFKFILGGSVWEVVSVDHDNFKVSVEPAGDTIGAVPAWIGEEIPVPFEVAQEVGEVRSRILSYIEEGRAKEAIDYLVHEYPCTRATAERVVDELLKQHSSGIPTATHSTVVIESQGRIHVIHACFGTKVNETLAHLIPVVLQRKYYISAVARRDPYRILVITTRPVRVDVVLDSLLSIDSVEELLVEAIKGSKLFLWRLFHVARRFGLLTKDATMKDIRKIYESIRDTVVEEEAIRELLTDTFDVSKTEKVLDLIKSKSIEIKAVEVTTFSSLSTPILYTYMRLNYVPATATPSVLVDLVKKRINEREVKLLCIRCLKWCYDVKVKYVPDDIKCPVCGARTIAVLHPRDDLNRVIKLLTETKTKTKKKLSKEDQKLLERVRKTALLVLNYGKRAVIALAGRGIGPATAVKILNKAREAGEEALYLAILEAEREYARTRPFWED